jgi:hypothetical protein
MDARASFGERHDHAANRKMRDAICGVVAVMLSAATYNLDNLQVRTTLQQVSFEIIGTLKNLAKMFLLLRLIRFVDLRPQPVFYVAAGHRGIQRASRRCWFFLKLGIIFVKLVEQMTDRRNVKTLVGDVGSSASFHLKSPLAV